MPQSSRCSRNGNVHYQRVTGSSFFTTEVYLCMFKCAGSWLSKQQWAGTWRCRVMPSSLISHYVKAAKPLTAFFKSPQESSSAIMYSLRLQWVKILHLWYMQTPSSLPSWWSLFHQLSWPFWSRTMESITMTMREMMGEERRGMEGGCTGRCKIYTTFSWRLRLLETTESCGGSAEIC